MGCCMDDRFVRSAKNGKSRAGKSELLKHLQGKRLTRSQAIKAKCFDCNGMGEVGECEIEECSLLPYSPYRTKAKKISGSTTFIGEDDPKSPFKTAGVK